ncbi:MAG: AraC family transcriptional regulator ligand-binding domain-containing protein [Hyphomonas sp.]
MENFSTVSVGLVKGLIEFSEHNGAPRLDLMRQSGIQENDLHNKDNHLPITTYKALINAAQRLCEDRAIALKWAAEVDMSELSIVGLIMNASETMAEAFEQLQRYSRLAYETESLSSKTQLSLEQIEKGFWLVERRADADSFYELTEISFARLTCGPRRFLDQPHVLEAHFRHDDPGYAAVYERVFNCPVHFSCRWNALKLHPDVGSWPVAAEPDYVFEILVKHADQMLEEQRPSGTLQRRVERHLTSVLHTGSVSAESVAQMLGMSRQTLHRKLKAEGTSFREIIENTRETLAKAYLSSDKLSVSETAYLLGYADPAAFSRAFKRMTGVNPRDIQ